MNLPLWKKALIAFLVTFAAVFLTGLIPFLESLAEGIQSGNQINWNAQASALIGLVLGGLAAAVRIIVAFLPVFKHDTDTGASGGIV